MPVFLIIQMEQTILSIFMFQIIKDAVQISDQIIVRLPIQLKLHETLCSPSYKAQIIDQLGI